MPTPARHADRGSASPPSAGSLASIREPRDALTRACHRANVALSERAPTRRESPEKRACGRHASGRNGKNGGPHSGVVRSGCREAIFKKWVRVRTPNLSLSLFSSSPHSFFPSPTPHFHVCISCSPFFFLLTLLGMCSPRPPRRQQLFPSSIFRLKGTVTTG